MDVQTVLVSVLASGVIAALITGYVSRRSSERAIQIENITKERRTWRDKIREQSLHVQQAATANNYTWLAELRLTFCLNVNPCDKEDRAIIAIISKLSEAQEQADKQILIEFSDRVALLLKHDWDRTKWEAKSFPFRRFKAPSRAQYLYENWKNLTSLAP